MRILRVLYVGLGVLLLPSVAAADPADEARQFAKDFAVPRFEAVAAAAQVQLSAWTQFCADRTRGDANTLKRAYNDTADAWANIEFVRIGPAAVALRVERFNYWNDRNDAAGKALGAMLASSDPASLEPQALAAGSVAGQGEPILERLLYDKGAIAALKAPDGARRCAVGTAIARSLSVIAGDIVRDWTAPNGAQAALLADTRWGVAFADPREAASVMLTDLVSGLELLKDFKVGLLFHDIANAKAPRLAEGSRSGRTMRNIALNLAAIREGLKVFTADAQPSLTNQLDAAFDDAERTLNDVAAAQGKRRMDPKARTAQAQLALDSFRTLSQTAMTVLPQASGIPLGFNNLDGD